MRLKLARKWFTEKATCGILYVNDKFFCYTIEDVVRPAGEKVNGKTAIPWGTYKVVVTYSNRFQKPLPLLINVPNFVGVRIHSGNQAGDTEGCILVGMTHSANWIGSSQVAMNNLLDRLDEAYDLGQDISIEIAAEATR
jgi:hypothetical protein